MFREKEDEEEWFEEQVRKQEVQEIAQEGEKEGQEEEEGKRRRRTRTRTRKTMTTRRRTTTNRGEDGEEENLEGEDEQWILQQTWYQPVRTTLCMSFYTYVCIVIIQQT